MATAIWNGTTCEVRVDADFESNWAVSVLSGERDPGSLTDRPAAPLMLKLRAKTRWLALDSALRTLKELGRISDYALEPRPQDELAAEEAEKARIAARRSAGAKAADEEG